MQKVVGSSPIIRLEESPASAGLFISVVARRPPRRPSLPPLSMKARIRRGPARRWPSSSSSVPLWADDLVREDVEVVERHGRGWPGERRSAGDVGDCEREARIVGRPNAADERNPASPVLVVAGEYVS